tara:strand:+ start:186 stop:548 length:363 start_codon:yes stop_codon:yes gene_type:complete
LGFRIWFSLGQGFFIIFKLGCLTDGVLIIGTYGGDGDFLFLGDGFLIIGTYGGDGDFLFLGGGVIDDEPELNLPSLISFLYRAPFILIHLLVSGFSILPDGHFFLFLISFICIFIYIENI